MSRYSNQPRTRHGAAPSHDGGGPRQGNRGYNQGQGAAIHHDNDPYLPGRSGQAHGYSRQHGAQHAVSQVELFRTIQASTQMLYNVFDNNIGMIEELEKHETHGKVENSGMLSHVTPVHQKKPKEDVFSGIELQLKCLQAQMESLPPEITKEAKKILVEQTIKWAASREAAGIPYGDVDRYCKNVLEILLFGAPKELPNVDRGPMIRPTPEQVNEALFQMARQRHLGDKQDEEFVKDPRKKAKLRSKRQSEDIRGGVRRFQRHDHRLAVALDEQGYVPDASMDTT